MWKSVLIGFTILLAGILLFNVLTKLTKQSQSTMSIDISIEEFKEKRTQTQGVIIDVRTKDEYNEGHLAEADFQYNLMNGDFHAELENLDKDQTYYLYCRSGNRSGQAARIMKSAGFENAYNIGGFEDLANAGFETE